jgi:hypothetical protein
MCTFQPLVEELKVALGLWMQATLDFALPHALRELGFARFYRSLHVYASMPCGPQPPYMPDGQSPAKEALQNNDLKWCAAAGSEHEPKELPPRFICVDVCVCVCVCV